MKRGFFRIFCLICLFAVVSPLYAQMTKKQMQTMYVDYLKAEGYSPTIDDDGDVSFKKEGLTYYILVNDADQEYFTIVHLNFWEIESKEELAQAYVAAVKATRDTKIADVFVRKDEKDVGIEAEIFINKPEDFKKFLDRLISSLQHARKLFIEEMKK